ncbi:MAG: LysR family transcriptional regulator [Hyphomicrobiales bacterium]|nr:LysR family transcriptional regulator [Hyphomicrobiales bacterium]
MTMLTDWTLVRSFLAVMRGGSLSQAARTTRLTQPTIGRHIDEIEAALKLALFTRSPTGLIPTDTARSLFPSAEAMESAMASLIRTAEAGGDAAAPHGTVRITASEVMGLVVLPAILASIRHAHPDITFELVLNNRTDNLLRRDADIAVRMARPVQTGLVARKIGVLPLGLYAHRNYLARFGAPASPEALTKAHLIGFDRDDHSARSVASGVLPISRNIFAFRCDHDAAQMEALKAGLGIGVIQVAVARRNPDLVPVLAGQIRFSLDVWLAVHEDQRHQPAISATFEGLAEGLRAYLAG